MDRVSKKSVSLIKPSPLIPIILCKSSAQTTPLPISAINHTVLLPLKRNFKRKTHGLNVTVVRLDQLAFLGVFLKSFKKPALAIDSNSSSFPFIKTE